MCELGLYILTAPLNPEPLPMKPQAVRHPSMLAVLQAQSKRAQRIATRRHTRFLCVAAWGIAAAMWATYVIPQLIGG